MDHLSPLKVLKFISGSVKRRRAKVLRVIASVMLISVPGAISAQDDDVSEQVWLDYNPIWALPSSLELYGDVGVRMEVGSAHFGQVEGPVRSKWKGWFGASGRVSERSDAGVDVRERSGRELSCPWAFYVSWKVL